MVYNNEAPGDTAQAVIAKLRGTEHPFTGREPVIVSELQIALNGGHLSEADEMAHNYAEHGHIDTGLTCDHKIE